MNKDNSITVLVTGAGGLLGSELVEQLMENDYINVIATTSQKQKYEDNPRLQVMSNDEFLETNTLNNKIDFVFNCAFPRSSKPAELSQGILFTEKIVKKCAQLNVKNMINISSQSVYSQKEKGDVTELSDVEPETFYGMTKFACERIVSIICKENNMKYSNIRLASLTGPSFDVRMTNRFVKATINKEKITIKGGHQKISYLDVRDAASAIIKMLNVDSLKWQEVYNLGNDNNFTLLELIEEIKSIATKYAINNVDVEVDETKDNFNNLMNNNLFCKTYKWTPQYTMPLMVKEQFELKLK